MKAYQNELTKREADVLKAIVTALRREGRAPTIREIGVAADIKSLSHVEYLLRRLEEMGQIERIPGSRGIKLPEVPGVPIHGRIAAGEPLDLYDGGYEHLDLGAHVRAVDTDDEYALRVRGDSMIEDHIFDGDYVLVRPARTAPDGAIVVALHKDAPTDAGAATVKRFYREPTRRRVRLQPANDALEPIFVSAAKWDREWEIQGVVTAIYRPCHL
jgi:repressor LexA